MKTDCLIERLRQLRYRLWPVDVVPGDGPRTVDVETLDLTIERLEALDLCMGAFNGFDNWRAQQGHAIPADEVVTLDDVQARIKLAQAACLAALPSASTEGEKQ